MNNMQKKKQVFTWPISALVIVVSFLSVLVVLQQVQAAWVGPGSLPNDTTLSNTFVFTPLAQDLDIGTRQITGTGITIDPAPVVGLPKLTVNNVVDGVKRNAALFEGKICLNGTTATDCIESWSVVSGGGGSGDDWKINYTDLPLAQDEFERGLYYVTSTPSSGFVGIGTDIPEWPLDIRVNVNKYGTINILNLNSGQDAIAELQPGNNMGYRGGFGIGSSGSSRDAFRNRIFVGSGSSQGTSIVAEDSNNPANPDDIRFFTDGMMSANERMRIMANGNVGIRTNNPGAFLDVNDVFTGVSSNSIIRATSWHSSLYGSVADTDNQDGGQIDFRFGATESSDNLQETDGSPMFRRGFTIRDATAGINRFFISATSTTAGNIGIGTNYPNKLLHVYKTSVDNAEIDIQSNSGVGNHWGIYNDRGTDELRFWKGGANRLMISSTGDVDVTGNLTVSSAGKYLKITSGAVPSSGCALAADNGRLYVDTATPKFYVCINSVWKSITFDVSGGGGGKVDPIDPLNP